MIFLRCNNALIYSCILFKASISFASSWKWISVNCKYTKSFAGYRFITRNTSKMKYLIFNKAELTWCAPLIVFIAIKNVMESYMGMTILGVCATKKGIVLKMLRQQIGPLLSAMGIKVDLVKMNTIMCCIDCNFFPNMKEI